MSESLKELNCTTRTVFKKIEFYVFNIGIIF